MQRLAHSDVLFLLVQLGLMLFFARTFGELAKRLKQPPVVGEILGGILLGPSVFALVLPDWYSQLFLVHPNASIAMDGIFNISLIMLLFISGMEIELPLIWRNGRSALYISFIGLIIPLIIGIGIGWYGNETIFHGLRESRLAFSLFLGTALSITALPVIAKILLDLNLLNSKIGSLIIACAMMNDFVGWILFAIVLNLMPGVKPASGAMEVWQTVLLTIAFAVITLTIIKFAIDKGLSVLNQKFTGPGSNMTIAMMMCFAGAIFTEYIGIHAIFGAFLMGIAFGESTHFSERSKEIIHQFVSNIFAPLFFVSIGLKVNFVKSFDLEIILIVLVIAFITKIIGGYIGGRAGKLSHRESMAIGFGINARGAMEIILATVALQAGLIGEPIFVALTVMAILTSVTSGHFIKLFIKS
ncbi:MAG: cation:proton antiporter [Sphingobacteriales bacterium]|nr:MAG: cation:proton antiporter [Sphingobacteriales bacterium]